MFRKIWLKILTAILANGDVARKFIKQQLDHLAEMAALTATTVDDILVGIAQRIVDDDEAWHTFWEALKKYIGSDADESLIRDDLQTQSAAAHIAQRLNSTAKDGEPEIDPITIISLILMFIEWWRNRNKEEPLPTPALPPTENHD